MIKPWPKRDTQVLQDSRIFRLQTERLTSPRTGNDVQATVLEAPDWVNVIALTPEGRVVMVRQYRFGSERVTLEAPGGAVDPGESPLEAARRELREETGYQSPDWQSLGDVAPNPAFLRNRLHCFVARECRRVGEPDPDPGEDFEVVTLPLSEVRRMLVDGGIDHALVLAIFLRFELSGRSTEG